MQKLKKRVLKILLSFAMMFCIGLGTALIVKGQTPVSAATAITETSTSVTVSRYDDTNHRVLLDVGETEDSLKYANTPANLEYTVDKLSGLNTLDFVLVNGKKLRDLNVTSFFTNLYNEKGFAFHGITLSEYDTVTVLQGAQFPTHEYLTGGAAACYTASAKSSWMHDGTALGKKLHAFTETNVSVSNINEYASNNHFGFTLSTSDYNSDNQALALEDLDNLNTLSYITYNGESFRSKVKEVTTTDKNVYLRMWQKTNTIYFPMNEPKDGDTVIIPAGTQFPSDAYAEDNNARSCYVTTQGTKWTFNGTSWTMQPIIEYSDTTVSSIEWTKNAENTIRKLMITLSPNDFGTTTSNQPVSAAQLSALNTLDSISVDGKTLSELVVTAAELNAWTYWGRFSVDLNKLDEPSQITFAAGTQFPSMAYAKDGLYQCYQLQESVTWVRDGSTWTKELNFTNTSVSNIEWTKNAENTIRKLMITLSPNDFGTTTSNQPVSAAQLSKLNTLDSISVDGKTLSELGVTAAELNAWTYWGRFSVDLNKLDEPSQITFAAGTQFPSMGYAKDGSNQCYKLQESVTWVRDASTWSVKTVTNTDTSVSKVQLRGTNRILFFLSANDYASTGSTQVATSFADCNTLDKIQIYVGDTHVSLRDAFADSGDMNVYFNVWGETNSISFPLKSSSYTISTVTKVVIPAGTQFPSYSGDTIYTTTEEKVYLNTTNGSEYANWTEQVTYQETPTSFNRVAFNDTGEPVNNVLYFWLTENDYGTTAGSVDAKNAAQKLNTHSYIEVDGKPLSSLTLEVEYINFFSRWGAFGLKINGYNGNDGPSTIYVKAGCQLPSLDFAQNENSTSVYVIEDDTWIVYDEYHDVYQITTQSPSITVSAGDTFPTYESIGARVFLGWELGGALYRGGSNAPSAGTAQAVYLDYALEDGASIRISNSINESGIRFTTHLQESSFTAYGDYIVSVGTLILPLELLGSEAFEVGHSKEALNFYVRKAKGFSFNEDGVMTMRATMHTIREANYNRDYAARAYVQVQYADNTTGYAYGCFLADRNVRNIYEVATAAYKAQENLSQNQKSILEGYAERVVNLTFNGETLSLTEGTIASAISGENLMTQSIEDCVATIKISTENENLLLIVDGEPIRGDKLLTKTFENNLLTLSFLLETASGVTFYASDNDLQNFYQEYFALYTMGGTNAVTHGNIASGWSYQMDWYMNGVAWLDATAFVQNNGENATTIYSADGYAIYYFDNIDVDKNGNVYTYFNDKCPDTPDKGPNYSTVTSYALMPGQGWTLPNVSSNGWKGYNAEFNGGTLTAELEAEDKATDSSNNESGKWKVNGSTVTQVNGVAQYTGAASSQTNASGAANTIVYERTDISYSTYNAPFIELRLIISDPNSTITDYAVEWKVDNVWYSVKQSEYANNPYDFSNGANGMFRSYFPLYTHANYGAGHTVYGNQEEGKTVTGLRVVLIAKNNTDSVTVGLDYIRATADSRHSTNCAKYIISLNEYASNHNDLDVVARNITRARKAMLFQLEPLQGKNGLIDLSYLHRHDSYEGAANGFWDIYPAGNKNTDANIYFYESLLALADMEEALANKGITVTESAQIEWHDLSGVEKTATYDETADSLRNLANNTVKTQIQDTFYNSSTGRFAWSVRDVKSKGNKDAGTLMDYGFTELNLHAIEAGIATDAQARSIMQWICGTRTVDGDKVTGTKIYEAPFAPRSTTADNQKYSSDFLQIGLKESDFTKLYIDQPFGELCQDGGSIIHVSYYDVLARAKVNGVDDAYNRLSSIVSWFKEVQAKNTQTTTNWSDFFKNYYSKDGDLQGNGVQGKYGLQDEFKEAIMLVATAPKIFLGLDAKYDTLTIAPNLGTNLTHFGMQSLSFGEHRYTCYATNSSIAISGLNNVVNSGLKVKLSLNYETGKQVYLNGKLLDSSAYTVENGKVTVLTDFANCTLQVK